MGNKGGGEGEGEKGGEEERRREIGEGLGGISHCTGHGGNFFDSSSFK